VRSFSCLEAASSDPLFDMADTISEAHEGDSAGYYSRQYHGQNVSSVASDITPYKGQGRGRKHILILAIDI